MQIKLQLTNATGTRIDKELDIHSRDIEEIFAELAQGVKWAKDKGSEVMILEVHNFSDRA